MNIKPILFNTEMVRAILDGRKTSTRRVIKQGKLRCLDSPYRKEHPEVPDIQIIKKLAEPPYQSGDILYVRETFCKCGNHKIGIPMRYEYRADTDNPNYTLRGFIAEWRPSIHMPKEAARIWLKATNVRVERLQDITINGLQKEGIMPDGYLSQFTVMSEGQVYFDLFKNLWDSTIKKKDLPLYGWDANPWVWAIEFEKIEKPEDIK